MTILPPLLLIGGGKMGGALLTGWQELGLRSSFVVDPSPAATTLARPGVDVVTGLEALPQGFEPGCVVLAVKPQTAPEVLPALARFAPAPFVSIMAGLSVAGLSTALGGGAPVVRAMPNSPAAVRQGITAAFAGPGVSPEARALADTLLRAVGQVVWVEDEDLLDPVTAVSGSGPAYVFLLAELLEHAAIEQGIPPALARQLARVTVTGSGALLAHSTDDSATLRRAVTSPGGTTERALAVLMAAPAWPRAVSDAVREATERSRELRS